MAIEYSGLDLSFVAAEDLSSYQFHFVHQASDTTVDLIDGATEWSIGILQNAPALGEIAVVRVNGTSKLVMNALIAVGVLVKAEFVSASDNGKGDAADTDGDLAKGLVIMASGAEDDIGAVILCTDKISIPA